jgi:cytochrome c-type biogenesis protein CcmH/NrfG
MARAEGQMGRTQVAAGLAKQATDLDPANGDAWLVLSLCERATGDLAASEQSLGRAAISLGDRDDLVLARAMLYRAQGQIGAANVVLQDMLRRDPQSAHARALYIEFARQDGRLGDAAAFLQRLQGSR